MYYYPPNVANVRNVWVLYIRLDRKPIKLNYYLPKFCGGIKIVVLSKLQDICYRCS